MTSEMISGIAPFTPQSTFAGDDIRIPRGMFLGGRIYTRLPHTLPYYISYISPEGWGVADNSGEEFATIHFTDAMGHITTMEGEYAGCLKGRTTLFNNGPDDPPCLEVFLGNLTARHELDTRGLVWDVNFCSTLTSAVTPRYTNIEIPDIRQDTRGYYYITGETSTTASDDFLRFLTIRSDRDNTGTTLGHYTTPLDEKSPYIKDCRVAINPLVQDYRDHKVGIGDVIVAVKDNDIIISTRGAFEN